MVAALPIDDEEILTGEAVALDVQPLGVLLRALGAVIDALVTVAVGIATLITVSSVADSSVAPIVSILTIVMLLVVAPTVIETASHGRSLGKLVVGGRVVRTDGGSAGFRHAFIRALVGVLELWLTLGVVALLTGMFTPRAQRLGDLVAGTYCERTRAPRVPPVTVAAVPGALRQWAHTADVAALPPRLARRLMHFLAGADGLAPAARARVADALARETAPFVAPLPDAAPETLLRAVAAVRFDRELRAIRERDRVADSLAATGRR